MEIYVIFKILSANSGKGGVIIIRLKEWLKTHALQLGSKSGKDNFRKENLLRLEREKKLDKIYVNEFHLSEQYFELTIITSVEPCQPWTLMGVLMLI